jgi:hypothetical protein
MRLSMSCCGNRWHPAGSKKSECLPPRRLGSVHFRSSQVFDGQRCLLRLRCPAGAHRTLDRSATVREPAKSSKPPGNNRA